MAMFAPAELLTDIFLRLPAKSILQLRCVCRDWLNVIDSKNFTNMHLVKNNTNCWLIVQGWCKPFLYSVDLNSFEETVELNVRSWWPNDRWHGLYGVTLWGSSNGLLCLSSFWRYVVLWNPLTKKHLLLPPLSFDDNRRLKDSGESFSAVFGFGYDSAADDYIIVSIVQHYTFLITSVDTVVKVFSLRSNSWRRVYNGFLQESLIKRVGGVLVRNSLHWLLTHKQNESDVKSIVAFDFRTEKLEVFSFASSMEGWASGEISIQVIEERIAVSLFRASVGFELWVMKEYGLEESWTKLISIVEPSLTAYNHIWPIRCCRNREMLVGAESKGCPTKVLLYDFQTEAIEEIPVRGLPDYVCGNCLFSESLVPLHSGVS